MSKFVLEILELPVSEIHPAKYNPRKDLKPGDPAYDKLAKVIERFDLVEPLVWNRRTGNLVGGHQRFKILVARGDAVIPVSVVDLDDTQEKALNLALNRQAGEWEIASLADLLRELEGGGLEMELTGFSDAELERLLAYTPGTAGLTDEDAIPEKPEARAKTGDVWLLGRHRLMCGDATDKSNVGQLLGEIRPSLMVTDPPYGVEYDPAWRARAGVNRNKAKMGQVTNDDVVDWSPAWLNFPGSIAYVWHAGRHTAEVQRSLEACEFEIRSQIIWAKDRMALSRGHYHWQHEPCWYAVRHGANGHWTGDRSQTTLWQIKSRDDSGHGHGTQKPVECMRRPILNHTNEGQCVYDPFMGSGTTIIAAEATGRTAFGMEINPTYVDVALARWEEFTGKKAERED